MVTEEKIINNALIRYRLGTILVWVGVLIWLPFILLRVMGEKPIFLWFLPFHLAGVIGGSRIRSLARKELGLTPPKKNLLRIAGHGMIFLGILVWIPYLYFKLIVGQPVVVMDYLPYHLIGVLGGVFLHVISYVISRRVR